MLNRPVVLVIEDNTELRHALREALGAEGYDVLAARDDDEAFDLLRAHQVDLLISDLTDTPTAESTLEAVGHEFPDLPVVALAEGASGGHPALFFAAWEKPRGYRTLPKPFRLGELLAVSREVLGPTGGAHAAP